MHFSAYSSSDIRWAQQALTSLGFDTKGVDGIIGPNTRAAILAFQKGFGIAADGLLGPQTMNELKSRTTASSVPVVASAPPAIATPRPPPGAVRPGPPMNWLMLIGGLAVGAGVYLSMQKA